MKLIIVNKPYESALGALFSTCIQAAESHKCCPNLNDLGFLEAAKKYKDEIEQAKISRDFIARVCADGLRYLQKQREHINSYIKKNPLPWYLKEYHDYVNNEYFAYLDDVKKLNDKINPYTGKLYELHR